MSEIEVHIEMDAEELESFREFMIARADPKLEPYPITGISPIQQREAQLISLIVALGGPAAVTSFVSLAKTWIRERQETRRHQLEEETKRTTADLNAQLAERVSELRYEEAIIRLWVESQGKREAVTLDQLEAMTWRD